MTDAVSTIASTTASTGTTTANEASALSSGADYEDFLQLLVAQMKYQDPLNPAEGTEFVAQLAQFSNLEQSINSNNKLDKLIEVQSETGAITLGDWIGLDVEVSEGDIYYRGNAIQITAPEYNNATQTSVVIRDQNGNEIKTLTVDGSGGDFTWDGTNNNGIVVDSDQYDVQFSYTVPGEDGSETITQSYTAAGTVQEVRFDDEGNVVLYLDNNAIAYASDVISVMLDSDDITSGAT